ncbi:MAG: TlpA disulfide reductase family protein [Bacteroidota bacterium]
MKAKHLVILITACLLQFSANAQAVKYTVKPATIMKNYDSFMSYYQNHLKLQENFIPYDENLKPISKDIFFKRVMGGNVLPLRITYKGQLPEYQLYKTKPTDDIKTMLTQIAKAEYGYYKTVDHPFPKFNYTDINGKVYSSENTKGKILILKAWDLSCKPCIAEMPELNKIVKKYAARKDILFVSLAADPKAPLKKFAKRVKFDYAIAPVTWPYLKENLHALGVPLHWVVNKKGVTTTMSYDYHDMLAALDKEASAN